MSAYFSGAQGRLRLEGFMDKLRAVVSVLLMFSAALTGYYLGSGISAMILVWLVQFWLF